jgi:hypothetical protein
MKIRHNKKRNTAFLYESLIKELTKAILKNNLGTKNKALSLIRENFHKGSVLKKELELYNTLLESKGLNKEFASRLLVEVKRDFDNLNRKQVFNSQTQLIKKINETFSKEVFANFISNYRDIATVGQFFQSSDLGAKRRLLVEDKIISLVTSEKETLKESQIKHVDKLTYKTFIDKFNSTYQDTLSEEQKKLLTNFIVSFSDNGLGLKSFLNEEIGRLKTELNESIQNRKLPLHIIERSQKVVERLDDFSKTPITEQIVQDVFYIQDLVGEITKNG